jgi:chitodextrinase
MALGSVTHAFDENQRIVPLSFQQVSGGIQATLPVNANVMPPGYYMLFLIDTNGVPSVSTMLQVITAGAPDTTPPSAPGGLTATPSSTQVSLTWTASTDNVGVTGYHVERCQGAGCTTFVEVSTTPIPAYTNTGLTPATTYRYRVRATDAAGLLSGYSSIVTAATLGVPDTTPPTAPSGLAPAVSGTQVTLTWTAATDNVGVTGYRVERCQTSGCANFAEIGTATAVTYVDSALPPATSYTYRVRATDAAGLLGPYSNTVSAITGSAPPVPSGLVAAYGFDEAGGSTVTDASGNGNTGTLAGATRTGAGKAGGALSFNGTTARVTVPDAPSLDLTSRFTLEAWVAPSTAPVGWRSIVAKDVDRYYLLAGTTNQNRPGAGATFGTANQNVFGTAVLPVNSWTHLAATYDGTALRLFVNGIQVASGAQTAPVSTSNAVLTIGANFYGEHFAGLIDEVRIYNRALTAGEIQADMATPIHP